MTTGFDYIIPLSADSITERYKLKFESSVYPQIPCHKWTTRNNLQAFFFDKTENKHKFHRSREGLASTTHFVLVVETQRIHGPKCFKNPDKKKTFLLNQNVTCTNYDIYVATCVICNEPVVDLGGADWTTARGQHLGGPNP